MSARVRRKIGLARLLGFLPKSLGKDPSRYPGKWVATLDGRVIAVDATCRGIADKLLRMGPVAYGAEARYIPAGGES